MGAVVSPLVYVSVCPHACFFFFPATPGLAQGAWIAHKSNGHALLRGLILSLSCVFRS